MNRIQAISQKIKILRKNRNINQSDLADAIGISHRYLQKLESGTVDYRIGFLEKLSQTFNIPPCFLLNDNSGDLDKMGIHCSSDLLNSLSVGVHLTNFQGDLRFSNNVLEKKIDSTYSIRKIQDLFYDQEMKQQLSQLLSISPKKMPPVLFGSIESRHGIINTRTEWNMLKLSGLSLPQGCIFITSTHVTW